MTLQRSDNIDRDNREIVIALAAKLYEEGKLTLGHAAYEANREIRAIPFDFPVYDLSEHIRNA